MEQRLRLCLSVRRRHERHQHGAGNLTSIGITYPSDPSGDTTVGKSYDADNRTRNNDGNTSFANDGNGNPYEYLGATLYFDPENRLTYSSTALTGSGSGTACTYGYNGDGLRAWKYDASLGFTYFLYDGDQPVCELSSTGAVTAVNTFGADGLVSRDAGGSSAFYEFDLRGCVAQRLSSSGSVLSSHYFDAYGSGPDTVSTDPWTGPWSQFGGYTDMETGWTLCTHRYYVGEGRWLTRDPMSYAGGINLYGYCGNDPVNLADSSGYGFQWQPNPLPPITYSPGSGIPWWPGNGTGSGGQQGPGPSPVTGVTGTPGYPGAGTGPGTPGTISGTVQGNPISITGTLGTPNNWNPIQDQNPNMPNGFGKCQLTLKTGNLHGGPNFTYPFNGGPYYYGITGTYGFGGPWGITGTAVSGPTAEAGIGPSYGGISVILNSPIGGIHSGVVGVMGAGTATF